VARLGFSIDLANRLVLALHKEVERFLLLNATTNESLNAVERGSSSVVASSSLSPMAIMRHSLLLPLPLPLSSSLGLAGAAAVVVTRVSVSSISFRRSAGMAFMRSS